MPTLLRRFSVAEVPDLLAELTRTHEVGPADERPLVLTPLTPGAPLHLYLPLVAPPARWLADPDACLDDLGRQLVVLVQAGAVSLGLWSGPELIAHKVFKRYVVRGRGRAQPTHLKTRGKSRYGSRLRLQNARRLLEETGDKVAEWRAEHGAFDAAFRSCPVRLWPAYREQLAASLPEAVTRIPMDVHVPNHDELLRVRGFLERGWLEAPTLAPL